MEINENSFEKQVTQCTAPQTTQQKYGFNCTVDLNFDEAIEKTREALKTEGFGILSEIRRDEKLKEKLVVDFRRYVILGARNPPLAYETLQQDINIRKRYVEELAKKSFEFNADL